nr:MAG: hypothetical protein [Lokiarchaeota virus Ratatoskr Meg22_1012]
MSENNYCENCEHYMIAEDPPLDVGWCNCCDCETYEYDDATTCEFFRRVE